MVLGSVNINEFPPESRMKEWTSLVMSCVTKRKDGHHYIWINNKNASEYVLDPYIPVDHVKAKTSDLFNQFIELPLSQEPQELQRSLDAIRLLKYQIIEKYQSGLCGIIRKILSLFFTYFKFENTTLGQQIAKAENRFSSIQKEPLKLEEEKLRCKWHAMSWNDLVKAKDVPTEERQNYLTFLAQKTEIKWNALGVGLPPGTQLQKMAFDLLGGDNVAQDVKEALQKHYRLTLERGFASNEYLYLSFESHQSKPFNPVFFDVLQAYLEQNPTKKITLQFRNTPLPPSIIEKIAKLLPSVQTLELNKVNLDDVGATLIASQLKQLIEQKKSFPWNINLDNNPLSTTGIKAFKSFVESKSEILISLLTFPESSEIYDEVMQWNLAQSIALGASKIEADKLSYAKAYWQCFRDVGVDQKKKTFGMWLYTSLVDIFKLADTANEKDKPHYLKLIGALAEEYYNTCRVNELAFQGVFALKMPPFVRAVIEEKYLAALRKRVGELKENNLYLSGNLFLVGGEWSSFYYKEGGERLNPLFLKEFGEYLNKQPYLEPSYEFSHTEKSGYLMVDNITLDADEAATIAGWFGHYSMMRLNNTQLDSTCIEAMVKKLTELMPNLPKIPPRVAGQAIPFGGGVNALYLDSNPLGDNGILAFKQLVENPHSRLQYLYVIDKTVSDTLSSTLEKWKFAPEFKILQVNNEKYPPGAGSLQMPQIPRSYEEEMRSHGVHVITRERPVKVSRSQVSTEAPAESQAVVWKVQLNQQELQNLNANIKNIKEEDRKHIKSLETYLMTLKEVEKIELSPQLQPLKHLAWLMQQIALCYTAENKAEILQLAEEKKIPEYLLQQHEKWLKN